LGHIDADERGLQLDQRNLYFDNRGHLRWSTKEGDRPGARRTLYRELSLGFELLPVLRHSLCVGLALRG
jgi:hypothetical protein